MSHLRPQLTIFVNFFIQTHMINQWKECHCPLWAACAQEPNCLLFDIFEDPEDRGHFTAVEVWGATKQWFLEETVTKDYYNELWHGTEYTYRKSRVIRFAERLGEGSSYRSRYLEVAKCMDQEIKCPVLREAGCRQYRICGFLYCSGKMMRHLRECSR
jgi:hypothetical protein